MKLGIIGYPSKLGGADTELDHAMVCWSKMGIEMHVVHTGEIDANLRAMELDKRPGVTVHEPRNWAALSGMPVISFCNGKFLEDLPEIRQYCTKVLWVNCMSWLFDMEKQRHKEGMIDAFLYQRSGVKNLVSPTLRALNENLTQFCFIPYFDIERFQMLTGRPNDKFRFCHISREDLGKYHPQTRWLFETMVAPVPKEGHILGWDANRMPQKLGQMPSWVTCEPAGARPVAEIYEKSHVLISFADPSLTENLPRVAFEAMASGTLVIADQRGGWETVIEHGRTGWLCRNDREFAYYCSRAAFEIDERETMVLAAQKRLADTYGSFNRVAGLWKRIFELLGVWN